LTHITDLEEQALEVIILILSDGEKACALIGDTTGCLLIGIECIGSDQQQGGTGVYDPTRRVEDSSVTSVRYRLVDSPIVARRSCCGDRYIIKGTSVPKCSKILEYYLKVSKGKYQTYLVLSTPPKVSSPLATPSVELGLYEMLMESVEMVFWAKRLSTTVGTLGVFLTVPSVRSTGPMLNIQMCE
jgi:hypothetical protein